MPAWQRELSEAIRHPRELLAELGVRPEDAGLGAEQHAFRTRVPRAYAARMTPGDPGDPLLQQVLPRVEEARHVPGYGPDPVGDQAAMTVPGLLHKYHGRALLVTTGACAVHCRYCFRREFPYADANPRADAWERALGYIAADPSIQEVILSGGDPLSLPDATLAPLAERIAAIPHVQTLRVHTRLPVVVPARVTRELTDWLGACGLHTVVVVHANHAQELDDAVAAALGRLRGATQWVFNQAVLLAGINDSVGAQADLARRLFACGVLPYYLHVLDPVRGASHFEVSEAVAREVLAGVASRLPGYLVPRLVREEPGRPGKTPLWHDWANLGGQGDRSHSHIDPGSSGP